jgi:hypothetical protein
MASQIYFFTPLVNELFHLQNSYYYDSESDGFYEPLM